MVSDLSYYNELGIQSNVSSDEIKKAYKKMALKWHPDKHTNNKDSAEKKFKAVSEAYHVLSDEKKRKLYDQFGKAGIDSSGSHGFNFSGVPHGFRQHRQFGGGIDPNTIFRQFFRTDNIFEAEDFFKNSQPQVQQIECFLSLEELYSGGHKKYRLRTTRFDHQDKPFNYQSVLEFDIKPGWKEGTKITFENEGDQKSPQSTSADVQFIIKEKSHPRFKRIPGSDDLEVSVNISLKEALTGGHISFEHLNGRKMRIPLKGIVNPGTKRIIQGEGMPSTKQRNVKGNLIIVHNIIFPDTLTDEQTSSLNNIL